MLTRCKDLILEVVICLFTYCIRQSIIFGGGGGANDVGAEERRGGGVGVCALAH